MAKDRVFAQGPGALFDVALRALRCGLRILFVVLFFVMLLNISKTMLIIVEKKILAIDDPFDGMFGFCLFYLKKNHNSLF